MTEIDSKRTLLELNLFNGKIVETRKGRGGLIYIVERDAFPRRVAFKTMKEFEGSLPVVTERFDREAGNWFEFSGHPLVITPNYVRMCDGVPLICMPYCDGDLRDLIEKRPSLIGALTLSLQIVKGIIIANSRGMEHHQDIKPENLLYADFSKEFEGFPPEGVDWWARYSVRIADFGVANAWRDNHPGGTNAYRAPEQHDSTLATPFLPDVFAVGLVIAELFQGYHPAASKEGIEVGKWKGSKLKRWTTEGHRNFAPAISAEAQELVGLLTEMLAAVPSQRPSLSACYKRLAGILKALSPATLEQLELLFDYFDYIAEYGGLEAKLDRQLKLSRIASQHNLVKSDIRNDLKRSLQEQALNVATLLRIHHLANTFHRICGADCSEQDKSLLVEASTTVVNFVTTRPSELDSDCLWPAFFYGERKPTKLASDIEAIAEILSVNVERLQDLGGFNHELVQAINNGGIIVKASVIMTEASKKWQAGRLTDACLLLNQVRKLVPKDAQLERLQEMWMAAESRLRGNIAEWDETGDRASNGS
ncbi:protein kinase [Caballeronia sp. ATUFL_F1_KS4A]|uniref:protein kinase domain-containing protein n=1 Tax=Caballeronia sp. ATUFL_F1_KS4A TaxID=2921768 RepID=UPI0020279673|nr:protein kinase [Caballeronia sp. ATUFL_F1_KS4A]